MKKAKLIFAIFPLLMASCFELDNYDAPNAGAQPYPQNGAAYADPRAAQRPAPSEAPEDDYTPESPQDQKLPPFVQRLLGRSQESFEAAYIYTNVNEAGKKLDLSSGLPASVADFMFQTIVVANLTGGKGKMARLVGDGPEAQWAAATAQRTREAFHKKYWNGSYYVSPGYKGQPDDRAQALAVVSGTLPEELYSTLRPFFRQQYHASPYMEKYVFHAMMEMGYGEEGFQRHNRRFSNMVMNDYFTTLFEGWGIGSEGFGGGSVNHAWSGGGMTVAYQSICGIRPMEVAYNVVGVLPDPAGLKSASASVLTPAGRVSSSFENTNNIFVLNADIPSAYEGVIGTPKEGVREVKINGVTVWKEGKPVKNKIARWSKHQTSDLHLSFDVRGGVYKLIAVK